MQADDNEATVATAIDRYNQACEPLLDHFREAGLLSSIDTGALSSSSPQRCDDFSSEPSLTRSFVAAFWLTRPRVSLCPLASRLSLPQAAVREFESSALTQALLSPP